MNYNSYFFSHEKKVDKCVMISFFKKYFQVRLVSFPNLNHSPLALVMGMRLVYYHIRSHGLGADVL